MRPLGGAHGTLPPSTLPPIGGMPGAGAARPSAEAPRGGEAYSSVPDAPDAAASFASELRDEQRRRGGGLVVTPDALEAVLERRVRASSAAKPLDERHLRAWGHLICAMCNEGTDSTARSVPPAPPGVSRQPAPEALTSHRQARAHGAALDRLASAAAGRSQPSGGVPLEEEEQARLQLGDIEDMDGLVQTSLREQQDGVQVELGESLLTNLLGEVVAEMIDIDARRAGR